MKDTAGKSAISQQSLFIDVENNIHTLHGGPLTNNKKEFGDLQTLTVTIKTRNGLIVNFLQHELQANLESIGQ